MCSPARPHALPREMEMVCTYHPMHDYTSPVRHPSVQLAVSSVSHFLVDSRIVHPASLFSLLLTSFPCTHVPPHYVAPLARHHRRSSSPWPLHRCTITHAPTTCTAPALHRTHLNGRSFATQCDCRDRTRHSRRRCDACRLGTHIADTCRHM